MKTIAVWNKEKDNQNMALQLSVELSNSGKCVLCVDFDGEMVLGGTSKFHDIYSMVKYTAWQYTLSHVTENIDKPAIAQLLAGNIDTSVKAQEEYTFYPAKGGFILPYKFLNGSEQSLAELKDYHNALIEYQLDEDQTEPPVKNKEDLVHEKGSLTLLCFFELYDYIVEMAKLAKMDYVIFDLPADAKGFSKLALMRSDYWIMPNKPNDTNALAHQLKQWHEAIVKNEPKKNPNSTVNYTPNLLVGGLMDKNTEQAECDVLHELSSHLFNKVDTKMLNQEKSFQNKVQYLDAFMQKDASTLQKVCQLEKEIILWETGALGNHEDYAKVSEITVEELKNSVSQ